MEKSFWSCVVRRFATLPSRVGMLARRVSVALLGLFLVGSALGSGTTNLASLASNVTQSFSEFGALMIAVSYVAGIGFGIAAVFKFKQHKDNPTQMPIGTPFSMLAISAVLVFLPGFFSPAGATIFGSSYTSAVGGYTGGSNIYVGGATGGSGG